MAGSQPELQEKFESKSLITPSLYYLAFTRDYAPRWEPSDAFRELYQNWYFCISLYRKFLLLLTKMSGRKQ